MLPRRSPSPPPPPLEPALLQDPVLQLNPYTAIARKFKNLEKPQEIRRKSSEWMRKVPPPISYPYRPPDTVARSLEMKTIDSPPYNDPYVIFTAAEVGDSYVTVISHNPELTGKDRPDLYRMEITRDSEDLLNPGEVNPKNYFRGDVILVKTMEPKPGVDLSDLCRSFNGILNSESHQFWMVGEFYLCERNITRNLLIYKMPIRDAIKTNSWERGEDARGFWRDKCIVQDQNVIFQLDKEQLASFGHDQLRFGDIMNPIIEPVDPIIFLERESQVTGEPVHSIVPPTIICIHPATPATKHLFDQILSLPTLFRNNSWSSETLSIMAEAIRLGVSAKVAMENKNRDSLIYCTKIQEVERTIKGPKVKFSIRREIGEPKVGDWMRSTNFLLNTEPYTYSMRVLDAKYKKNSSRFCGRELLITAALNSKKPSLQRDMERLEGGNVIVLQEIQENKHHLKNLPNLEELEDLSMDSPIKNLLERMLGKPGEKAEVIVRGGADPQTAYLHAITTSNHPAITVNSCFRGGKTTVITTALNTLAMGPTGIHIATATTNKAVSSMVKWFLSKEHNARAVRVVSKTTNEHSDRSLRTEIDFPKLWIEVFRKFILSKVNSKKSTDGVLTQSALYHLSQEKMRIYDEDGDELVETLLEIEHPLDLFDTFLKIYQPRVIFGTVFAITESLVEGLLKDQRTRIQTVQFDDANRLALADFYSLGVRCPRARFGFLGDTRQLPPFCDLETPWTLKQMAVGEVFQKSLDLFPSLRFKKVHGESTELVGLCSNFFYNWKLAWNMEPSPLSVELNEHLENTFGSALSLQILDLCGSTHEPVDTSLINKKEAELAVKLAQKLQLRHPEASIAITTYYKSQAGRVSSKIGPEDDFNIGTVDCSQDYNFDINIVLTTRTTNFKDSKLFLSSPGRLNVALSRAKSHCFLLTVKQSAEALPLWKELFQKVSDDFVHDAEDFVERF